MAVTYGLKDVAGSAPGATDGAILAGLHIESDFPLDGLAAADAAQPNFGRVYIRRVTPREVSDRAAMEPSGILLAPSHLGSFLITGRDEILVAPVTTARDRSIVAFLFGPCFAVIAYLNGVLPLHAGAIRTPHGCVAFVGGSGAGKSTLVASLAARGHTIHSDDVCLLRKMPDGKMPEGRILAWPGIRWLRLTDESARALGYVGSAGSIPPLPIGAKHSLRLEPLPEPDAPLPLRAIYVLEHAGDNTAQSITKLLGGRAAGYVLANAYRSYFSRHLGLWPKVVTDCVSIADQTPVYLFRRPFDYARLPETLALLERDIGMPSSVGGHS